MDVDPLVSCLCVTRGRVSLLRRAVRCFFAQTYEPRELVVVFESDDAETRTFLELLDSPQVFAVEVPVHPKLTLGALRNIALRSGSGTYIAQWDDDDWYAPSRLEEQMRALRSLKRAGCVLLRWTIFDHLTQRAYVSGKRAWEGSLVSERDSVPRYSDLPKSEDTPVLAQMLGEGKLVRLDRPELYIYTYHGHNTWDRAHWDEHIVPYATPIGYRNAVWIRNALNPIAEKCSPTVNRKALFVWEQGANLGHLSNLRLPMEVALREGFDVWLAVRELHRVHEVFSDLPVHYLQAPLSISHRNNSPVKIQSYGQLIYQQCFGNDAELASLISAWRALYELVQPQVIIAEHAPIALAAFHDLPVRKIHLGTGFTVPPVSEEVDIPFGLFPDVEPTKALQEELLRQDATLLSSLNGALRRAGAAPLGRVGDIFSGVDAEFILSWPQFDHFGARRNARYLGIDAPQIASLPDWPAGSAPAVFGYLETFPSVEFLLRDLQATRLRCLLYIRGLSVALRNRFSSQCMVFVDHLVDVQAVARDANWVINHGSHGTASLFSSVGLPQLLIPRHQEQLLLSLRLVQQGCAAMAFQDQTAYVRAIGAMQANAGLKTCALELAHQLIPFRAEGVREVLRNALGSTKIEKKGASPRE